MSEVQETNQRWLSRIKALTGVDRAIAFTVAARVAQILGSTGTVLLIVHFLSPIEQGYYYTLLSLVALQTIFEMGFSFVILQLAAHECIHLKLRLDGTIEGDSVAHSRLASILQKTLRWYSVAAVAMVLILVPVGEVFLSRRTNTGAIVAWQGPWIAAVLATAVLFLLNPIFSFLEGCGQVREVAAMRMAQGFAAIVVPCSVLLAQHGLYAPAAVNTGFSLVGIAFLWSRRGLLGRLLQHVVNENGVSWRDEVWHFQWKLGVSWLCSYFTVQVLTPILFVTRGPIEAGQMGMSMSIAAYLWTVVMAWMTTKATLFGGLIAREDFDQLDRIFFHTLKRSLAVLVGLVLFTMAGLIAVQPLYPKLASRMVPPAIFALLLFAALSTFVVQSQAVYLRAHKSEPFLGQSILVAVLTSCGAYLLAPSYGIGGVAMTYFSASGIVGLFAATAIFQSKRKIRNGEFVRDPANCS